MAELRPPWQAPAEAANHCLVAQILQCCTEWPAPEKAHAWEYQTRMDVVIGEARRGQSRQERAAPEDGPPQEGAKDLQLRAQGAA